MKNLLLFGLIFFFGGQIESFSQEYIPFLDTTKRWVFQEELDDYSKSEIRLKENLFFFQGSKVLNGLPYRVLKSTCSYRSITTGHNHFPPNPVTEEWLARCDTSDYLYLREDTLHEKVFAHASLIQPFDTCNGLFYQVLYEDEHAMPWEELLINFSLIDTLYDGAEVMLSDRYSSTLMGPWEDEEGTVGSGKIMHIRETGNPEGLELFGIEEALGANFLKGQYGYFGTIFFPIRTCHSQHIYDSFSGVVCYSIGDEKISNSYYSSENEPCNLRQILSVKDLPSADIALFRNPVEEGVIHFFQPQTGRVVIQDPSGRVILETILKGESSLSFSGTLTGVYLLQLEGDRGTVFQRFLVNR